MDRTAVRAEGQVGEPGWYNDEADPTLARWHDGERWTEHTLVKSAWPGPGSPPPPVEPEPTIWVPSDRPDPLPATSTLPPPPPLPPGPSLKDRYRGWPQWARIAGPVAVGLLVLAAVASAAGDDGDDGRIETSTDIEDADEVSSISEAASSAVEDLGIDVSRGEMIVLVTALCDGSSEDGATALSAITSEPDDQGEVLEAAGDAAEEACPETVEAEPDLLNDVLAAVVTTTTSTTVAANTLPEQASSTTPPASAPRSTSATTRAPAPTQPPATPPATQPPSPQCHPSYSGCLNPSSPDYDCAGGSGNGPDYTGPVEVYGSDPYGLDADGDGVGCED